MGEKFPRKFGKYHLLGPLAQGGMGALYLAATGDRGLERLLVVKTVLPHLADSEYLARFRDEAKIVVQLSHGNLIPVFDAGQVEGELFLAMEFVEGKDLRAMWNRCAKKAVAFPVDVAVFITKELCRGLAYAHSFADIQLVHRDVSPPNVLVSYSGEVKLTDFGLAASTLKLEKTAPGIIYGKVAYMSPEQARGERLDGRSDLYASAIILWELLTGRQLFPPGKEQPQDLLQRARDPSVLAPSKRAPRVPPELDEIVLRGLAANRDERYADGEEFREALQGWLADHAPSTDAARLAAFMHQLFAEDMASERAQREELLEKVRRKARTLPPTDELRQIVEGSKAHVAPSAGGIRAAGSVGRRAMDRGGADDRRRSDRRAGPRRGKLHPVDVPAPGPGGATVLTPQPGDIATAAAKSFPNEGLDEGSSSVLGQILDGRYRINELIGEGGMGRVYLAEHVEIGKRVAVKILHPVYGRLPDLVERFRREARAASKIGHPHIVDVTDSGTTADDSAYFVMEYLEGVELAGVIDREGAMDLNRSLRIVSQICRALAAAHAVGIIHRDLKPENIFLTIRDNTSDFVKVLDFGIAKSLEGEQARAKRLTSPGMAMGTPEYMAPEQAAGRPADVRSDVYSLGAIMYEMLTGIPPYDGDNFMEILTKKATMDPSPPRNLRPDLPQVVNDLVVRAMSRNPDQRPASMEAFEYEINKCLAGRGAAVAQIIGLKTDPQLVADLNPGIQIRNTSGIDVAPSELPFSGRSSGSLPAIPHHGHEPVGAALSSAGELGAVSPSDRFYTDSVSVRSERSRVGTAGWIALGAVLTAAAGVLLFVTSSEWSGNRSRAAAAVTTPADASTDAGGRAANNPTVVDAGQAIDDGVAKRDSGDESSSSDSRDDSRDQPRPKKTGDPDKKPDRQKKRQRHERNDGAPSTRRQARALLTRAKKAANAVNWSQARALYTQITKGKYYRAQAYLGLAKVAFETRDTDGVIRNARSALRAGGGDAARMFLGHAYFKKARYREALEYYDAILKRKPNNGEAQRGAAAARKMIH